MGQANPKIEMMQSRQDPGQYTRFWVTPLTKTCCESCPYCCYALWCPCCSSYGLRKQALYEDLTRYICCNGACPCSGRCGEQSCPACCLCLETFCCFGMSVATTRFMIQDEMKIQSSKCDNCIIGCMIALQYLACLCHIIACITGNPDLQALSQCIDLIADVVWCTVCACMQTQHHIELKERDANMKGNGGPSIMAPAQQAIATSNQYPMMPSGGHASNQVAAAPRSHAAHKPSSYPSTQHAYR